MSGQKGRSGGNGRKSREVHRLGGTLGKGGRHQERPLSPTALSRLADAQTAYDETKYTRTRLSARLAELVAAGTKADLAPLLREIRHQALLLLSLSGAIARLELEVRDAAVSTAPSPFDEFFTVAKSKWPATPTGPGNGKLT